MAGIYIHIPFCKHKCHYCNFFSTASSKYQAEIVDAILMEATQQKDYLISDPVETIYFGGGTPSVYDPETIGRIIRHLDSLFKITKGAEITMEVNPDDISPEYLAALRENGINRLSMGIQSFNDNDLEYLGRRHDAQRAVDSIQWIKDTGFDSYSIDMIFGVPGQSKETLIDNLRKAIDWGVPHISAYALTVEEKTPLELMIRKGKKTAVNDADSNAHFFLVMETLENKGYQQYEISNYSLPGHESKHNSNYWEGIPYLGLGPSAHSFDRVSRRWNVSGIKPYIDAVSEGKPYFETEVLSQMDLINESVMIALRTSKGLDLQQFENQFGVDEKEALLQSAEQHLLSNSLILKNNTLVICPKARIMADGIAADLFVV